MKVVICGSISIRRLTDEAREQIRRIVALGAEVLVGDAYGVDTLVQQELVALQYTNVTVYHAGGRVRNNVGRFRTVSVPGSYTDRDRAMCAAADYGLALWDGKSRGTGRNRQQMGRRMRTLLG